MWMRPVTCSSLVPAGNLRESDMEYKCVYVDPETGEPTIVKVMTKAEIEERLDLNIKNTATAGRQRVLEQLSKQNGHLN